MSSRSLMGCLLALGLLAACDRQSPSAAQQDNGAPTSGEVSGGEVTGGEVTGGEATAPASKAEKLDRSHKGEAAPTLAFQDPAGKPVTLAAFRGRPVLVNLWATWCAPCVAELPTLDRLAKSRKVRVVAVSQDMDAAKVAPFLAAKGVTLDAYRDPKLGLSVVYRANLPTTILFDAAGREVWRVNGGYEWDGADAARLIAEAG